MAYFIARAKDRIQSDCNQIENTIFKKVNKKPAKCIIRRIYPEYFNFL